MLAFRTQVPATVAVFNRFGGAALSPSSYRIRKDLASHTEPYFVPSRFPFIRHGLLNRKEVKRVVPGSVLVRNVIRYVSRKKRLVPCRFRAGRQGKEPFFAVALSLLFST